MAQTKKPSFSAIGKVTRKVAAGVGLAIVVVVLLLALSGKFHRKIGTSPAPAPAAAESRRAGIAAHVNLVPVTVLRTPVIEPAVGTIKAVHEASVASKLMAKVTEVNVQAGQEVKAGDILVRLDDQDLRAQLRQADAGVAVAQAAHDQAQLEYDRVKRLYDQSNASKTEFDQADTTLKSTTAELERATQARAQAQAVLDYATVRSPIDGRVVDKRIEVGDTASPGQVLVTLYDPTHMQLIAHVRESLTRRLKVGQTIGVQVDALGHACEGRVSEIVPEAQSTSRTFAVKVTGPCPPGVYSGMFGRLLIPLDEQEVLVIPKTAVKRVGQLDMVEVAESGASATRERRVVELGRQYGEQVQVLSGLRVGESVATPSPS